MQDREDDDMDDATEEDTDFVKASESSLEFWDNEVDDEVWNDA